MSVKSLFIVLAALTITSSAFGAQKIKHCGANAQGEVEDALEYVQNNLESIMTSVGDLTSGEKKRLRRKITRVNLKCMDHKNVCKKATRGGVSRHIFDSAVVICYNNIRAVKVNQAFCSLADVILHEIAHTANVDKDHGHNNGPNADRVYRTGTAAYNACRTAGLNGSIPYNTND